MISHLRIICLSSARPIGFINGVRRDVPSNEAIAYAGQQFPWVTAYDEGRSYQELEVVHMFPEMQVQKGATVAERKQAVCVCVYVCARLCTFAFVRKRSDCQAMLFLSEFYAKLPFMISACNKRSGSAAHSWRCVLWQRMQERLRLESLVDAEMLHKRILVAQRDSLFMNGVPDGMKSVFKDPVYERDVLQRQLRTQVSKVMKVTERG